MPARHRSDCRVRSPGPMTWSGRCRRPPCGRRRRPPRSGPHPPVVAWSRSAAHSRRTDPNAGPQTQVGPRAASGSECSTCRGAGEVRRCRPSASTSIAKPARTAGRRSRVRPGSPGRRPGRDRSATRPAVPRQCQPARSPRRQPSVPGSRRERRARWGNGLSSLLSNDRHGFPSAHAAAPGHDVPRQRAVPVSV